MCVVSNVYDSFHDDWYKRRPWNPWTTPQVPVPPRPAPITDEEIEEFRRLVRKAKEQDAKEGNFVRS